MGGATTVYVRRVSDFRMRPKRPQLGWNFANTLLHLFRVLGLQIWTIAPGYKLQYLNAKPN